jgi:hypothetical protein
MAQVQPGLAVFIVGIVMGLLLLGIAPVRSRAVPAWFGVALAGGGFTHPFLGSVDHLVQGVGRLVGAVGFAGASLALRCMPADDLARAPASRPATPYLTHRGGASLVPFRGRPVEPRPARRPATAAWARSPRPNLARIEETWLATVREDSPSRRAMAGFE